MPSSRAQIGKWVPWEKARCETLVARSPVGRLRKLRCEREGDHGLSHCQGNPRGNPFRRSNTKRTMGRTPDKQTTHIPTKADSGRAGAESPGRDRNSQGRPWYEVQDRQQSRVSPVPARRPTRILACPRGCSVLAAASAPAGIPPARRQISSSAGAPPPRYETALHDSFPRRDPFPGGAKPRQIGHEIRTV